MKKKFLQQFVLFGILTSLAGIARAQTPNYDWAWAGIAASASANPKNVVADANGNIYVAGHFGNTLTLGTTTLVSAGPPSTDIFVAKLDTAGNFIWAKKFGYADTDYCNALALDGAGNIYLAGHFSDSIRFDNILLNNGKYRGIYVAKLNPDGQALWADCSTGPFNATVYEDALALAVNPDGSFFMGGSFGTDSLTFQQVKIPKRQPTGGQGLSNGFVVKYSSNGTAEWGVGEGVGTIPGYNEINKLVSDDAGNVFVGGILSGPRLVLGTDTLLRTYENDVYFGKINASGNYLWVHHIWGYVSLGAVNETLTGLALDSSYLYVAGNYMGQGVALDSFGLPYPNNPTPSALTNPYVYKLDTDGTLIWGKAFGNADCSERLASIHAVPGQGLLLSGMHKTGFILDTISVPGAASCSFEEGYLTMLNTDGQSQWARTVQGANHDSFRDAVMVGDKIYAAGVFSSPVATLGTQSVSGNSSNFNHLLVTRLSFPPPIVAVPETMANDVTLFPNPAQNLVTVTLSAPLTRVLAFNSIGKQTELPLANDNQLKVASLRSGLYVLQLLTADGKLHTARLLKQ